MRTPPDPLVSQTEMVDIDVGTVCRLGPQKFLLTIEAGAFVVA